jgi:hypothetical protein
MVRIVSCAVVLLASGVVQSAPFAETTYSPDRVRFRFLSLAEARAIALELADAGAHSVPRAERERNVNQLLFNVENAYWILYGSYWQLHSREQGLRLAYETCLIAEANGSEFARAWGQYKLFRAQCLQALDTVFDNERELRTILGLPTDHGVRLVPSDAPNLVEKKPDWGKSLVEALNDRPELQLARAEVYEAKWSFFVARNFLRPMLQLIGIEKCPETDGSSEDTSRKRSMRNGSFTFFTRLEDWLAEFPSNSPCVQPARMRLARAYLALQDQEMKANRFLGLYYRRLASSHAQFKAARAQREAFATQTDLCFQNYRDGVTNVTLGSLLEAQRTWADSLATECQAIVNYNLAQVGWEYAKGAILAHAHLTLSDKEPSSYKKRRAVARERQRTREQVRREAGVPVNVLLMLPAGASLPALWKSFPPLHDN